MSKTVPTEASSDAGPTGYLASRLNAVKHGILSRFTVLPWESADEYVDLLAALVKDHQPVGVTEEHLVEELAGVMWRKQRLRLAEAAVHRAGLQDACGGWRAEQTVRNALAHRPGDTVSREGLIEAVRASDQDTAAELRELDEEETRVNEALEVLRGGKPAAYARASAVLGEDAREAWQDALEAAGDGGHPDREPGPFTADAAGLREFLEDELLPWYARRRAELANRPLVQRQACGEAFSAPKLEALARYETHLDRKLERVLGVLIKLRELRQSADRGSVSQNG